MYTCDNWIVLKAPDDSHYRLLAGTSGGYLSGDSWRLNSGIIKFEDLGNHWAVHGSSGSIYKCHKNSYTIRMNCAATYDKLIAGGWVELPEDTDWLNFDWLK
jgi:hypothetical protein